MLNAADISLALARTLGDGRALAIVSLLARDGTALAVPERMLVEEGGAVAGGTLGERSLDEAAGRYAAAMIADEKREVAVAGPAELFAEEADRRRLGELRVLLEVSRPQPEVIVCGGGHVGQALARAARFLDFAVTVIDDRPEFTSRARFPDERIRLITDDFVAALRSLSLTRASHIVIVTRGHRHDEICLKEVVEKPARYIGMIGSRRRTTTIREHLRREGVSPESLHRVHAPIGLDIGAQTPEEIALAILAEIVLVRRGGAGRPKSADGPMAKAR
ncbi:MAG: XdhC family protein [Blastocatellia bacterium]|nr:XdhC family protein [Blastocatellia bacterium]